MSSMSGSGAGRSIVIYQHGFGGTEEDLRETIELVVRDNPYKHIAFVKKGSNMQNSFINMDKFSNGFSNSNDRNAVDSFLDALVDFAKDNPSKNVHIRTKLGGEIGIETIENQSKKLQYILNYLVETKNVDSIVLVGHSQGGLVNLETAIARPQYIKKMISITTPYSTNMMSKQLLHFYNMAKFFTGKNIMSIFVQGLTDEQYKEYEKRVNTLGDLNYYNGLKKRWDRLSSRPELHVIVGAAGRLVSHINENDLTCCFDGLVTVIEQINIKHATIQPIVDINLPCLLDSSPSYKNRCMGCYGNLLGVKIGRYSKKPCKLSDIDIAATIYDKLLTSVGDWITLKGFTMEQKLEEIFQTIDAALWGNENPHPKYDNFYQVYSHGCNHDRIRYNSLCIYCIRSQIE